LTRSTSAVASGSQTAGWGPSDRSSTGQPATTAPATALEEGTENTVTLDRRHGPGSRSPNATASWRTLAS
jgi:hypothetical protein